MPRLRGLAATCATAGTDGAFSMLRLVRRSENALSRARPDGAGRPGRRSARPRRGSDRADRCTPHARVADRVRGIRRVVAFRPRARRSDGRDPAAAPSVSAVDWRSQTGLGQTDSQTVDTAGAPRDVVARWCSWASPAPTPRLAASPWTTARRAGTTTPNPTSAPRGAPRTRPRTTASAVGESPTARWRPCRTRGTPPSSRSAGARGITPGPRG